VLYRLQDLTAQRQALASLGVPDDRIYLDKGLTGTSRARPGLDQALAAVRSGDTLSTYSCRLGAWRANGGIGAWMSAEKPDPSSVTSSESSPAPRTPQLYGLIGQIDATGCDTTDRRTRTSKPGCQPLSAAGPGDAWPSAVNDR